MKTENTLENKAQFLGHHIGCDIEWFREDDNQWIKAKLTASDFGFYVNKQFRVLLTPLSLISDEDVKEMYIGYEFALKSAKEFLESHNTIEILSQEEADYLRSKSYAIPFRDLSVEEYVNYGWAKLKTTK
jgi:hypothetical protein